MGKWVHRGLSLKERNKIHNEKQRKDFKKSNPYSHRVKKGITKKAEYLSRITMARYVLSEYMPMFLEHNRFIGDEVFNENLTANQLLKLWGAEKIEELYNMINDHWLDCGFTTVRTLA